MRDMDKKAKSKIAGFQRGQTSHIRTWQYDPRIVEHCQAGHDSYAYFRAMLNPLALPLALAISTVLDRRQGFGDEERKLLFPSGPECCRIQKKGPWRSLSLTEIPVFNMRHLTGGIQMMRSVRPPRKNLQRGEGTVSRPRLTDVPEILVFGRGGIGRVEGPGLPQFAS
jgi:hypothetical protein